MSTNVFFCWVNSYAYSKLLEKKRKQWTSTLLVVSLINMKSFQWCLSVMWTDKTIPVHGPLWILIYLNADIRGDCTQLSETFCCSRCRVEEKKQHGNINKINKCPACQLICLPGPAEFFVFCILTGMVFNTEWVP